MEELQRQIDELKQKLIALEASATIPHDVEQAFRDRLHDLADVDLPDGLEDAPLSAVAAPSGGTTVDSEARTAIIDLTTRLEDLGLIAAN